MQSTIPISAWLMTLACLLMLWMGVQALKSARYGGPHLSAEERCLLLLSELQQVPRERRTARFVCALVFYAGGEQEYVFEGQAEGLILEELRGKQGFAYDAIFWDPELKNELWGNGCHDQKQPQPSLQSLGGLCQSPKYRIEIE